MKLKRGWSTFRHSWSTRAPKSRWDLITQSSILLFRWTHNIWTTQQNFNMYFRFVFFFSPALTQLCGFLTGGWSDWLIGQFYITQSTETEFGRQVEDKTLKKWNSAPLFFWGGGTSFCFTSFDLASTSWTTTLWSSLKLSVKINCPLEQLYFLLYMFVLVIIWLFSNCGLYLTGGVQSHCMWLHICVCVCVFKWVLFWCYADVFYF